MGVDAGNLHRYSGAAARAAAQCGDRPAGVLWGTPGIGKSSLVRAFASLLGTQLAPEDLIGVLQIVDGRSRFCPPEAIAREEPYCLFLDELNAASPDVQKAFYSLILDRRIGGYELPRGSIVIGAGNRTTDNALARPMASALINRLIHVHLRASAGLVCWGACVNSAGSQRWARAVAGTSGAALRTGSPIPANGTDQLDLAGALGLPSSALGAALYNVTVTRPGDRDTSPSSRTASPRSRRSRT